MIHALSSYRANPQIRFKDQEGEEVVLLLLRRHPVTNFWWITTTLALLVLPLAALYLNLLPPPLNLSRLPAVYLAAILTTWYLFSLGFSLINFFDWFFNLHLITNKRVVDMDYVNLLYFRVSETNFGNIEDVTYKVSGLPQIIFNFGDVLLQTAGAEANFEMEAVPHPAGVHDLITDLKSGRRR